MFFLIYFFLFTLYFVYWLLFLSFMMFVFGHRFIYVIYIFKELVFGVLNIDFVIIFLYFLDLCFHLYYLFPYFLFVFIRWLHSGFQFLFLMNIFSKVPSKNYFNCLPQILIHSVYTIFGFSYKYLKISIWITFYLKDHGLIVLILTIWISLISYFMVFY